MKTAASENTQFLNSRGQPSFNVADSPPDNIDTCHTFGSNPLGIKKVPGTYVHCPTLEPWHFSMDLFFFRGKLKTEIWSRRFITENLYLPKF